MRMISSTFFWKLVFAPRVYGENRQNAEHEIFFGSVLVVVVIAVLVGIEELFRFVNVEVTVEVIDLVAEASCEKIGTLVGLHNAVSVKCANANVRGALNETLFAGNGEAAFHAEHGAGGFNNFGIDKLKNLSFLYLDNDDTAKNADLRCGETDTVCVVHGFQHIVKESFGSLGNFRHGTARFAKSSFAFFENRKFCHDEAKSFLYFLFLGKLPRLALPVLI
jgi:hypothetical protein